MKGLSNLRRRESFVLYIAMFVMGGCGLAYEYTFSRVASDLLGNSVRQWAVIIGVMMFFMGLGADLQKHLREQFLLDKFIGAEILLGLLGGFGPMLMLFTFGLYPSHYILVQYFFISAIGLLIGIEMPLLVRINQHYTLDLPENLGGVLKMDYIGALAGALVWVFLLPKFFTVIESGFVLGLLNVLVAGGTLLYFRGKTRWSLGLTGFSLLCLALLAFGLFRTGSWSLTAEQALYRDRIIFSRTTSYQHIVLTRSRADDISCYINGSLQFNSLDEHIYHENLVHPAFSLAGRRENILILGGGDGLALREVLKYREVKTVVLCDLDPEMTTLARQNPYFLQLNHNSLNRAEVTVLKNHALKPAGFTEVQLLDRSQRFPAGSDTAVRVQLVNLDAARFVDEIAGRFDLIIIDFPDPNSPELAKLYSETFYRHVAGKLAADGIMVQQSTSPVHAREAFLCIGRTMEKSGLAVVPYHDNVPSFGEWGWWIGGRQERYSASLIRSRLASLKPFTVPTRYLTPALVASSLEFGKNQLESTYQDVNVLVDSRVYEYYLQGWQR